MEPFPWWNEEHKKFAKDIKTFVDDVTPRDEEARWKGEFPWDIIETLREKGFCGAPISKEYGGMGLGTIGSCIFSEQMGRLPGVGRIAGASFLGGLRQIELFGTEEQKKRLMTRIVHGQLEAIAITDPLAGDAAPGNETGARREGDTFILTR